MRIQKNTSFVLKMLKYDVLRITHCDIEDIERESAKDLLESFFPRKCDVVFTKATKAVEASSSENMF